MLSLSLISPRSGQSVSRPFLLIVLTNCLLMLPTASLTADEPKSKQNKFNLAGVVEAISSEEISANTDQIQSLTVNSIVAHGTRVDKGDEVLTFKQKPITEQLDQAKRTVRLSELAFAGQELNFSQSQALSRLSKEEADRTWKRAQKAYSNFMKVDREREEKAALFSLKQSLASLENATEELQQLEQMYKEDDLTEESEEIVLKRAQQAVDSANFRYQSAKIQTDRSINEELPNKTADQKNTLVKAELAYNKSMKDIDLASEQASIELEVKRSALQIEKENLEKLIADSKRSKLTAAEGGIVIHGQLQRGKLSDKPTEHKVDDKVSSKQVVLTILQPDQLQIRVAVPEQHFNQVKAGEPCTVKFKSMPNLVVDGKVQTISTIPYAANQYDCVIAFAKDNSPKGITPMMTCEITFLPASGESEDNQAESAKTNPKNKKAEQPPKSKRLKGEQNVDSPVVKEKAEA